MIRILGIDPGSVKTGYGIIESNGQQSRYVDSGYIKLSSDSLALKLGQIYSEINSIIISSKPEHMAESIQISWYLNTVPEPSSSQRWVTAQHPRNRFSI